MSVVSGIIGASASTSAANTQADATKGASDVQLQMFREGLEATAPWREKGEEALNTLAAKVNAGPGEFTKSPGYDFRLAEGTKALERSAAAKGNLFSGRTGKELTRFGQDYATNDYQNFLANYYASLTPLQSLAGVGMTTASQNAVLGNQAGAQIGQNTIAGGNALAGGQINQANAITGASNTAANNYLLWKYLNKTPAVTNAAASAIDYSYGVS